MHHGGFTRSYLGVFPAALAATGVAIAAELGQEPGLPGDVASVACMPPAGKGAPMPGESV